MVSSNTTDCGSPTSRCLNAVAASPSCSDWPLPMPITVNLEAARCPFPLAMQALHVQGRPCAEVLTHLEHLQEHPWKAPLLSVDEQSPQPQPSGCACMRTEQAPQRHPPPWDRAETAAKDEQEGHMQEHPWAPLGEHEEQEHPAACDAAVPRLCCAEVDEDKGEVENAPPATTPAGMKNASALLATSASTAAPITPVGFMVLKFSASPVIDGSSRC